jgi:hypothetical protein
MKSGRYLVLALPFLLFACSHNPLDVDVSAISVPQVKIQRYDKAFFSLDTSQMDKSIERLHVQFGNFSDGFINNIICPSARSNEECNHTILRFLYDPSFGTREEYEECNKVFASGFSDLEIQLTDAFRHFRYYFPKRPLPKSVNVVMSGFNYSVFNVEGDYGIGIEFYLGKGDYIYDALPPDKFPGYRRSRMSKEYIAPNFVYCWLVNEFPYDPPKPDLVNRMVYEGKLLYLQQALLRNVPDSIITGYPQSKLDWAQENEAKMWATMIEQKKVYSEDEEDLNHFTEDGAFTAGLPKESPGKAGDWIGLRIVQAYMEKYPKTSLEELMKMKDGAAILNKSKYKPKF